MIDFISLYKSVEIDEDDKVYDLLTNLNKFYNARTAGTFKDTPEALLRMLKYEYTHAHREGVMYRVFSLAWTAYKKLCYESFLATGFEDFEPEPTEQPNENSVRDGEED